MTIFQDIHYVENIGDIFGMSKWSKYIGGE